MAVQEIDFEGTEIKENNSNSDQNLNDGKNTSVQQEDVTNLNGDDVVDINKDTTNIQENATNANDEEKSNNSPIGELVPGDKLEVDGITYTVVKNGDIVDEKGNIFKESKDVEEWLKSMNVESADSSDSITINSIQESLGVTITDESGNPIEFSDTPKGIKAYVDAVLELKSKETQEAAINRLYADNPLLKQFQDYVQVNGTAKGFGDIPDRSGIQLDKNNENQLIAVIKMAAHEFGNKSINDNYIKYLRDSGGLYDEAHLQLNNLVEKDKAYRKDIETKAAEQRRAEDESIKSYWENINKIINNRIIGEYKLPESFTKEVDGKKMVITPNDFFNYISNATFTDENGRKITGYQHDLAALTDEEYTNREMLDAWLMFTGGTYKDLIDMAVKEEQVRKLVIKSKQNRSTKNVKIVKQQTGKTSIDDILF